MREYVEPIWGWDEAEQRRLLFTRSRPTSRFIIESGGQAVGHLERLLLEDTWVIGNIQLHPNTQGQGLGTQIIQAERNLAKEKDLKVRLGVLLTNPRAEALYRGMGFVVTEETETHRLMESSQPTNCPAPAPNAPDPGP